MTYLPALLALLTAGLIWFSRQCFKANHIDWGSPWLNWVDGFCRLLCMRYHRLQLVDLPLPAEGPAILVANHISGLDPLLMIACSRRPVRFLIAREQYRRFGLQWLFRAAGCIPVDRQRSPEKALRQAIKALREGEVVALFPHGKIHLDSDPPRRTKAGAARLAAISKAPVVPLHISGAAREGHVVESVLIRGRAKVELLPVITLDKYLPEQLYSAIDLAVNGKEMA
ncbi:MAG: lysophospholipid acyltransferase family protein [Candidatus Thiodiazotropha sp.]|jgi:1-acyl-sn-glycerol-3-phosphate acyltransferase